MRILINTSTTETVEYLKLVNTIVRNNAEVSETVKAFNTLKKGFESLDSRLDKLETEWRRR